MPIILMTLKVIMAMWIIAVAGNYFRSLYQVFVSIKNRVDINAYIIKKAKSLLILGMISVWITSLLTYWVELLLLGKSTEYPAVLMFVVGILSLIITIVSAVLAVAVEWDKTNRFYAPVFRNFAGTCFMIAIVLWSSVWVIS